MQALAELKVAVGQRAGCGYLGLSRATIHRRAHPIARPLRKPRDPPEWALSHEERLAFLEIAHSLPFVDKTCAEIFYSLLDRGEYLCSIRTMYRILAEYGEIKERRNQLRHPVYTKPELMATGPNQLWSWDITKLRGPTKGIYYHLYVVLDVYSRYVVAWLLASRESEDLARELLEEAYCKYGIQPGNLTIHSDRGSAMRADSVVELLASLGVAKTQSRPYVSNDNPFSESQFKTMKYCPEFPPRFGAQEDARTFSRSFFPWYNEAHYHSGICWLTPAAVHFGTAAGILAERHRVLTTAYELNPSRFLQGPPRLQTLPATVWINPPTVVGINLPLH
jgi:putative transposase